MVEHQPSKLDTWVRFPSPALCDSGVVGNARPCQGRDRGFEPRLSLLGTLRYQSLFFAIGNYSVMFHSIKNALRRSALRRKRSTSLKRPAAGGESCEQDSFSSLLFIFFRKFFAPIFLSVFSGCETGIFFKLFPQMAL